MSAERVFPIFEQGELHAAMLEDFRLSILTSGVNNPDTKRPFTALEVLTATAENSPRDLDAQAVDLVLLVGQARAIWLADQVNPATSSTSSLKTFHGPMWGEDYLPASGGSGTVDAPGIVGATFVGSTTIGSPIATYGTSPDTKRFQVLFTETVQAGFTSVSLTLIGIDTGEITNLDVGTKIVWSNAPLGAQGDAEVTSKFTGGTSAETDAEFVRRLLRGIRRKQGAGNRPQMRAWAEKSAGNAVEACFVFACALHGGSTLLCPTQKRAKNVSGPLGRIPSPGVLAQVIAYTTSPGSPVVPTPPFIVVVPPTGLPSDLVLSLSMPTGSPSGWADYQPFPGQAAGVAPAVSSITDQTHFRITSSVALPPGGVVPQMMIWNALTSRFEQLFVVSVALAFGSTYDVVLSQAATINVYVGAQISPYSKRLLLLATTIEAYFDSLGTGQVIDVSATSADPRRPRAYRFPKANEEYPERAGAGVLNFLQDALGASYSDGAMNAISVSVPPLPTDVINGPNMIVAGQVSLSAL